MCFSKLFEVWATEVIAPKFDKKRPALNNWTHWTNLRHSCTFLRKKSFGTELTSYFNIKIHPPHPSKPPITQYKFYFIYTYIFYQSYLAKLSLLFRSLRFDSLLSGNCPHFRCRSQEIRGGAFSIPYMVHDTSHKLVFFFLKL